MYTASCFLCHLAPRISLCENNYWTAHLPTSYFSRQEEICWEAALRSFCGELVSSALLSEVLVPSGVTGAALSLICFSRKEPSQMQKEGKQVSVDLLQAFWGVSSRGPSWCVGRAEMLSAQKWSCTPPSRNLACQGQPQKRMPSFQLRNADLKAPPSIAPPSSPECFKPDFRESPEM